MFNRMESLKKAINDGNIEFAMLLSDFHLIKGKITQVEYDELNELAYPIQNVDEVIEVQEVVE